MKRKVLRYSKQNKETFIIIYLMIIKILKQVQTKNSPTYDSEGQYLCKSHLQTRFKKVIETIEPKLTNNSPANFFHKMEPQICESTNLAISIINPEIMFIVKVTPYLIK